MEKWKNKASLKVSIGEKYFLAVQVQFSIQKSDNEGVCEDNL
jgi:hypothetical protein